jgi:hypothetical protein
MSPASVSNSIQNLALFTAIRESALAYPIILACHLSSIAVFGGTILMTDLRLLGLAMTGQPPSDVIGQFRVWKRIGFVTMAASGILLAGAKAETYYANPYFQLKLAMLALVGAHALVFRRQVYRNAAKLDAALSMPGMAKLAACLSLALWMGIVSAGRLIAYYEPASKNAVRAVPRVVRTGARTARAGREARIVPRAVSADPRAARATLPPQGRRTLRRRACRESDLVTPACLVTPVCRSEIPGRY